MDLFEILFGSNDKGYDPEAWRGSDRSRHHGRSRNNWTDREDWNCGSGGNSGNGGMSGFDNYEESDF